MKKVVRFYTIFPSCENIHLIKDVGMIPFYLNKKYNFKSVLVTYKNGDYPYLDSEVNGLEMCFLKKITGIPTIDVLLFLLFNSSKIDILNCFHFMESTVRFIFFFRLVTFFSKKKKVYLKLDAGINLNNSIPITYFQKFVANHIDVVSVENKEYFVELNLNNFYKNKVVYIPNGFHSIEKKIVNNSMKENIILTVGRIGADEKANDILLKAFEIFQRNNKDWKVVLVGPIENNFTLYIDNYFLKYPYLRDFVIFTGAIYDRSILEEYYKKAKVFTLTSKYEGFPLVFLEAIKNGCTIISTDFPSARDICSNEKYGRIFKSGDFKCLSQILDELVQNTSYLTKNSYNVQELAYREYDWNIIIDSVFKNLNC